MGSLGAGPAGDWWPADEVFGQQWPAAREHRGPLVLIIQGPPAIPGRGGGAAGCGVLPEPGLPAGPVPPVPFGPLPVEVGRAGGRSDMVQDGGPAPPAAAGRTPCHPPPCIAGSDPRASHRSPSLAFSLPDRRARESHRAPHPTPARPAEPPDGRVVRDVGQVWAVLSGALSAYEGLALSHVSGAVPTLSATLRAIRGRSSRRSGRAGWGFAAKWLGGGRARPAAPGR